MSDITDFVGGFSDAMKQYVGAGNAAAMKQSPTLNPQPAEDDPLVTPEIGESLLPGMGGKLVQDHMDANGGKPPKQSEVLPLFKQAVSGLEAMGKNAPKV